MSLSRETFRSIATAKLDWASKAVLIEHAFQGYAGVHAGDIGRAIGMTTNEVVNAEKDLQRYGYVVRKPGDIFALIEGHPLGPGIKADRTQKNDKAPKAKPKAAK